MTTHPEDTASRVEGARKLTKRPWHKYSNRYDAAYVWLRWFKTERRRMPDASEAFIAGVRWEQARLALSQGADDHV